MMSSDRPFIRVEARLGEKTRKALKVEGLLDHDYKIVEDNGKLCIPLQQERVADDLLDILGNDDFELGRMEFPLAFEGPRTLNDAMSDILAPEEVELLTRAYDLVGDIAILEIPEPLRKYAKQIGDAFLSVHRNFTTVLAKKGAISGKIRVREYDVLAGQDKTHTVHREYGCKIAVDLAVAYFSPRLLEEHNRIANQVRDNEVVLDMFTGIGPFALHIAKRNHARVIAVDINEKGIELLKKSITMNRLVGTIEPIVADVRAYIQDSTHHSIDRVIMNHPSAAFEFVPAACHALKENGIMHYYDFISGDTPETELIEKITRLVEDTDRTIAELRKTRRVRDSAPHEFQMVADLIIE
jgi:tRNA (guanine37-N1)-methyltransferase